MILHALSTPELTAGSENEAVRLALAGLLTEHGKERLAAPKALGERVRLAMGDWYASRKQAQAIEWYEGLIAEVKAAPTAASNPPAALEQLAKYYQARGEYAKAVAILERVEMYTQLPYYLGHAMVDAAEMYRSAGDDKKAEAFYARATEVGNGYDAGRALLLQAYFYYAGGSLDQARKYSRQALDRFQALKDANLINASRDFIEQAQTLLTYSETWQKEPIISKPREVRVKADEDVNFSDSLFARFRVRTLRDVPLAATCDNPKVKVRVESDTILNSARFKYFVEKQVIIEIPLIEAQKGFDAVVHVSSPNLEGQVQVLLHVEP